MRSRRICNLCLNASTCITLLLLITSSSGDDFAEREAFFNFVRAVDPQNVLRVSWNTTVAHPCSNRWKGVKCNFQATTIQQIRFDSKNLTGIIDADSLCKLQNLKVLSLSRNLIHGNIPHSILSCRSLIYLNLSSNYLSGTVPGALIKLELLRTLDISNNKFTGIIPHSNQELKHLDKYSMKGNAIPIYNVRKLARKLDSLEHSVNVRKPARKLDSLEHAADTPNDTQQPDSGEEKLYDEPIVAILLVLGVVLFSVFAYFLVRKKVFESVKDREIPKSLAHSPQKTPSIPVPRKEMKPDEKCSELVFFVDKEERFELHDLFEATADLKSQTFCSSLYKVKLQNNVVFAVKRLKKLQVSFEEFGKTMRLIGNFKHPNILPLVGFNSTYEEKLLFYKYQSNGSLLNLLEEYIKGKREFPWKLRLSIATGIARGLDFIYKNPIDQEIIPHGNIKLSNILLDENLEPLLSEYGFSRFFDPKVGCSLSCNGYTAPEKSLSEQGDAFSFGIILLELLTGKTVESSGIDLPKWVRSIIREEWTGEVFDKEVNQAARQYAFPLLNVALKCVSHSAEDRPTMAEVMEKIEEVVNTHEDYTISSMGSMVSSPQDWSLLHSVIPETWDTPGSNY